MTLSTNEFLKIYKKYPDQYPNTNYSSENERLNDLALIKKYNQELISNYPWLNPMKYCPDNEYYDYTWTMLDDMPIGWRQAFGDTLIEEIQQELISQNTLYEFRVLQIKEKFGTLRFYHTGNSKIRDIINKYEIESSKICIECGKPATWKSINWISYFCNDCYNYIKDTCNDEFIKLTED